MLLAGLVFGFSPDIREKVTDRVATVKDDLLSRVRKTYAPVSPIEVTSTSEVEGTPATFAVDSNTLTSWVASSDDDEPTLVVRFDEPIDLARIQLWNGSAERFKDFKRIRNIHFVFDTGQSFDLEVLDVPTAEEYEIKNGDGVREIELHIDESYSSLGGDEWPVRNRVSRPAVTVMPLALEPPHLASWPTASGQSESVGQGPRFVVEEHAISLAHIHPISPSARSFRVGATEEASSEAGRARILNRAATRWRVVHHSRPSPDLQRCWSSAVPSMAHRQAQHSPTPPNRLKWRLRSCDDVGRLLVDAVIQVYWLFAPSCGGGGFLRRMWVELDDLVVDSGYDFNLRLVTSHPRNVGTARSPIACLPASLVGSLTGVETLMPIDRRFELWGDGSFCHE